MISERDWGIWLLIPAFAILGNGIAEIVRAARYNQRLRPDPGQAMATPRARELPPPDTSKIAPPPSVVEDTTRRFDPAAALG